MSDVRYLRSDNGYLAYRVEGTGPPDLLVCDEITMVSIDSVPDEPHWQRFQQRLAAFARVITYDRSGVGLSDGSGAPIDVERWARDGLAVLDAAGSSPAAVLGLSSSAIPVTLARTVPERLSHLVLFNGYARSEHAFGEPWIRDFDRWVDATTHAERPEEVTDDVAELLPSLATDGHFRRWWERAGQRGASPRAAAELNRAIGHLDLRPVLPEIRVPTLVLCRTDARFEALANARELAAGIPGARLVELPGADFFAFAGDADAVVDEIEEFLTGSRATRPVDRVLTTIFFSDIVGSTEQATRLGDHEWRARLDRHDAAVRRELVRFGGREVNTTGDGFIACFDVPARAIQCGLATCAAARQAGVEVRVGIHTGEVERRGGDVGGIAVHIAARVMAAADPGSVFVSSTVKDLVTGSDLRFRDHGTYELKGVPAPWRLYEAVA